jgi:hypothetical protein
MARSHKILIISTLLILLLAVIIFQQLFSHGPRPITRLESIKGIKFSQTGSLTHVTEKLAHADIELSESVLAKNLILTLTFIPPTQHPLYLGIRENAFWLSYPWIKIHESSSATTEPITKIITIPLTDKLADQDGSIDLMILTGNPSTLDQPDEGLNDDTYWQLHQLSATVRPAWPTLPALKDYLRSLATREKPL